MARSIGDQELELLKHVSEQGACSVGEVAEAFGGPEVALCETLPFQARVH